MPMIEPFIAFHSPRRLAVMIAAGVGLVLLGLFIAGVIGSADFDDNGALLALAALLGATPIVTARMVGWGAAILFGVFTLVAVRRLFDRQPVMRIDTNGIWYRGWSDAAIPWGQVRAVRTLTQGRARFVTFDLIHKDCYPPTTMAGRMSKANALLGYGDVTLNVAGTTKTIDDVEAAFAAFHRIGVAEA